MTLLLASCSGVRMEVCQRVVVDVTFNEDMGDLKAGSCRVYEIRDAESP